MEVLLALSPILLTLVLLLTRLPAWVAPAAGTAVAVLLALTAFGVAPGDLGGAIGAGVPTLLEILAIIAGGITLSRVMGTRAGTRAWPRGCRRATAPRSRPRCSWCTASSRSSRP